METDVARDALSGLPLWVFRIDHELRVDVLRAVGGALGGGVAGGDADRLAHWLPTEAALQLEQAALAALRSPGGNWAAVAHAGRPTWTAWVRATNSRQCFVLLDGLPAAAASPVPPPPPRPPESPFPALDDAALLPEHFGMFDWTRPTAVELGPDEAEAEPVWSSCWNAMALVDARGRVEECNGVVSGAVGLPTSRIRGRPFWRAPWWRCGDPAVRRRLRWSFLQARRGKVQCLRTPARSRSQEPVWLECALTPMGGGVMVELRDVTAAAEAQKTIHAYERHLHLSRGELGSQIQAVRRQTDELRLAREQAEAASRAKSQFLANMSHEIRTPMSGILGMTNLLLQSAPQSSQEEYLQLIRSSAEDLLGIINDILDFSKIEAGRLDLDPIEFSLSRELEKLLRLQAVRAFEKGLELNCDVAPDVPEWMVGDSGRIRQCLTNLLSNAVKFTERGEVLLRVRLREASAGRIKLHFSVEDTGIGVAPDLQRLIFAPFEQAERTLSRRFGGTGLGLSIVSRLVEMLGGEIWLESEPGKGSVFHFTVTLGASTQQTAVAAPPADDSLAGRCVLIVGGGRRQREILESLVRRWGAEARVLDSWPALRTACETDPDPKRLIALVDVRPGEASDEPRAERLKPPPGVFAWIEAGGEGARDGRGSRMLLKPFLPRELKELIAARTLRPEPSRPASPAALEPSGGPVKRVLLAEDNQTNVILATRLLRRRGHEVSVAENGRAAVDMVQREGPFDVILMDLHMPEMDGLEALQAIRGLSDPKLAGIPIVALTANVMKGDRERCLQSGFDDYIGKPINLDDFIRVVEGSAPA